MDMRCEGIIKYLVKFSVKKWASTSGCDRLKMRQNGDTHEGRGEKAEQYVGAWCLSKQG